jgi:hypothetical protein
MGNFLTQRPLLGNLYKQLDFLDLRYNDIPGLSDKDNIDTKNRKFYFTLQKGVGTSNVAAAASSSPHLDS